MNLIVTEGVLMSGAHVEPGTIYLNVAAGYAKELISTGRFRAATEADLQGAGLSDPESVPEPVPEPAPVLVPAKPKGR